MAPIAIQAMSTVPVKDAKNSALNSDHRMTSETAAAQNGNSRSTYDYRNPSLQVTADHKIKMVDVPIEEPGRGEVLLHVKNTGICGSDIHFWKKGAIGSLTVDGDCILGHEASGIVLKCGGGVLKVKPGDRVAIEPGVPCGDCYLCMDGRYNLCEDVHFAGVYPHSGTIQRFKVHSAKFVHKLPDHISFAEGALLEPLSVVLHGINTTRLHIGRGVLIAGAGPIGLLALALARASGCHPVVITDLEPRRLEFARKYVPSCRTYRVDPALGSEENARGIRELFGTGEYYAPDVALECTGVESSVCTAALTVRRGGEVLVIGVSAKSAMNGLPFMHMSLAEINLKFINRYHDTWAPGIAALSGGIIDVKPLVTHTFPLENALEAMGICADLTKGSIKVQIVDDVDIEL